MWDWFGSDVVAVSAIVVLVMAPSEHPTRMTCACKMKGSPAYAELFLGHAAPVAATDWVFDSTLNILVYAISYSLRLLCSRMTKYWNSRI